MQISAYCNDLQYFKVKFVYKFILLWYIMCLWLSFSGGILGLVCGITATLSAATMYEGGLNNFLINTVQDYAILAGTCASFGGSLLGCIISSLITNTIRCPDDANEEWQKLYDIDNPLNPWELNYREELKGLHFDSKPTFEQMSSTFKKAKMVAYIGGGCSIALMALVIPGIIMASYTVMSEGQFSAWVWFTQAWAVVMAIVVIVAPPAEEISRIVKQYRKNKEALLNANEAADDVLLKEVNHKELNHDPTQPVAKV